MAIFCDSKQCDRRALPQQYRVAVCSTIATNQCQTDPEIALCCAIATSSYSDQKMDFIPHLSTKRKYIFEIITQVRYPCFNSGKTMCS
ncbi:MAG: hypothetical protein F6K48_05030 [Okeania sp. SIO3H1]|uniref:hypothetical protein n=1 Tax=Okeania sp. SIO1I7 TaxID=2607772 RepID=UPI0013C635BB|nr:hypothetical protein [Okeania sp. SIO1I7]NEN88312.1 hypothetical protein [Okeania sp. SIO3H1]NET25056.1 hypothetical protein [Okeania sp. SIO1I7]